jgi:hypothetical protein
MLNWANTTASTLFLQAYSLPVHTFRIFLTQSFHSCPTAPAPVSSAAPRDFAAAAEDDDDDIYED